MKRNFMPLFMAVLLCLSTFALAGCGGGKDDGTSNTGTGKQETEAQATEAEGAQSQEESSSLPEVAGGDTSGAVIYPLTITDDFGNEVVLEKEPERVVSLSPSATEILFAIGGGDKVVGRTDYCSYPEEASQVESIGTYTDPNTELIIAREPEVVFVSDYLDDAIRTQLEAAGIKVVVFSANSVEAVEADILLAGQVLNLSNNAQEVVDGMEKDLAEVQKITAAAEKKKSVFVDIGSFFSAGPGSLLDDELNKLGAVNIAADSGETWPQLSVETIIEKNPDLYISLYTSVDDLKATSGLNELNCIKNDQIVFYDGLSKEADMIQRPGPRIVEGIRLLAQDIYPELFKDAQ